MLDVGRCVVGVGDGVCYLIVCDGRGAVEIFTEEVKLSSSKAKWLLRVGDNTANDWSSAPAHPNVQKLGHKVTTLGRFLTIAKASQRGRQQVKSIRRKDYQWVHIARGSGKSGYIVPKGKEHTHTTSLILADC